MLLTARDSAKAGTLAAAKTMGTRTAEDAGNSADLPAIAAAMTPAAARTPKTVTYNLEIKITFNRKRTLYNTHIDGLGEKYILWVR